MEENAPGLDLKCCKNCQHYQSDEFEQDDLEYQLDFGICRRFPPKRIGEGQSGFTTVFEEWVCGEHKPV